MSLCDFHQNTIKSFATEIRSNYIPNCRKPISTKSTTLHPLNLSFNLSKSIAPRKSYNSRERERQQSVNTSFNDLRQILPCHPPDKKLSKHEILRQAIKYIRILEEILNFQSNHSEINLTKDIYCINKEIISVHIGQAGVQLGSGIWELLAAEHGIGPNGICGSTDDGRGLNRFFFETPDNQEVPRTIFVDLEPNVIDEIKSGYYKELFSGDSLISGFEDAASIFSRGYFSFGRFFINDIMNKLNRQIELCDNPQAFCFTHSSGGGTGSGLFSLMVEEMEDFTKIMKMDLCIHPSFPISPVIVEPYNSVLTSHYTMDNTDISFLMDNEALYNLAFKHLEQSQMNYHLINRITSQLLSSITAATRFDGQSTTITEYLHNLVPYPRIHFPICSISPVFSPNKQIHYPNTIYTITKDAMSHDFQMIRCVPMDGKFMSCCLMYRGDVSPGEVYQSIERLKCYDRMQFVDWSPTGIKITVCNRPSTIIEKSGMSYTTRSLTMLCNNSSIVDALLQNTFRFHILFKKRAFVHWFVGEGMEEEEFKDSLENIACLVKDYEECAYPTKLLQNPLGGEDTDDKPKGSGIRQSSSLDPHARPAADENVQKYSSMDRRKTSKNSQKDAPIPDDNISIQENNDNINVNHNSPFNKKLIEDFISEEVSQISSFITPESIYEDNSKLNLMTNFSAVDELEIISPEEKLDKISNCSKQSSNKIMSHKIHSLQESCYLAL